jgi:nitrogen regulatory protein P-II 2
VAQSMKLVCAIIKPLKLDYVLESLALIGIRSLTVTETKGYGQKGPTEFYRGAEFTAKFRTMIKIEVAVTAHQVQSVVETILRAAKTAKPATGRFSSLSSIRCGIFARATSMKPCLLWPPDRCQQSCGPYIKFLYFSALALLEFLWRCC